MVTSRKRRSILRSRADHNRCRSKSVVLERAKSFHYVFPNNFIQIWNHPLQRSEIFGRQLWNRFLAIHPLAATLSQFQSQIIQGRREHF